MMARSSCKEDGRYPHGFWKKEEESEERGRSQKAPASAELIQWELVPGNGDGFGGWQVSN